MNEYKTMVTPKIEIIFIFNFTTNTHSIPDDNYKIIETLKIKIISIFEVTIVLKQ